MKRLYEPAAYGPLKACFWTDTVAPDTWRPLDGDTETDFAIIGGGFTGLNAALSLARSGASVRVLEAEDPGWGASGRNGGFCCLGGAKAPRGMLLRRYGANGLADWFSAERAAVSHVQSLVADGAWEVDAYSEGETLLAHSSRAWRDIQAEADQVAKDHGVAVSLTPKDALRQSGMGGPWHGAMTVPLGFALNPRKYHQALARAARDAGVGCYGKTPATGLQPHGSGWRLATPTGTVQARRVILATNGYSSEDLPPWLAGRTLPVQSRVIVTRPLTQLERDQQGWTSHQMAFDSRFLLHYFRLLPENRFLFGMRGGLRATPAADAALGRKIRSDFNKLFPEWSSVEITHEWSGLVCLMQRLVPFVGPVPGHDGLFAALGYHGNGVAMGSYAGSLIAEIARGANPSRPYPVSMQQPPLRFPLGRFRRALLWPTYAIAGALDL